MDEQLEELRRERLRPAEEPFRIYAALAKDLAEREAVAELEKARAGSGESEDWVSPGSGAAGPIAPNRQLRRPVLVPDAIVIVASSRVFFTALVSSAVLLSLVVSFLRLPPVGLMLLTLGWPPEWLLRGEHPCDIMAMGIIGDRIIIVAKVSEQR